MQDKFRGALLGVAVGDALGAPFEGARKVDRVGLERLKAEPGPLRYTDDTHMTLGLAESLVKKSEFDGRHVAMTFARNYGQEPWRGYGSGPPQVFRLMEEGVPWDEAGKMLFAGKGSYGNGAAMRVTPCGLLYHRHLEKAAFMAGQSAMITHAHDLGIEGAVLQACTVAFLVNIDPSVPLDLSALLGFLDTCAGSPVYREKLLQVRELATQAPVDEIARQVGNGIAAYEAVPAALWALLRNPGSFSGVVLDAISLGGDTDTIASMAGALSGAYLGEPAIPGVWRERVEGAGRLRGLADALLDLALKAGPEQEEPGA